MIRTAICGNIASGKTTVQRILEEKGYKVLDTDEVSHKLLTIKNKPLYDAFREYDVFENGEFSRYKVGQIVFSNEKVKQKLEKVLHPQIAEVIKNFFEENQSENIVFVAIPLLFETNMQQLFDKIIFVYADDNIRMKRLLNRNNYTIEQAEARMKSQMPQDEKVNKSDYIINNNGSIDDLREQIFKLVG